MKSIRLLLPLVLGTISIQGHADPLDEVEIIGISYGGTGCNQGTVGDLLASDRKSFTLLFDEYIAEAGPGVDRKENRKFCQIALEMHIPQGWAYTVADFDYRGWADLDRGVSATQTASYYFDSQREGSFYSVLNGKYNRDFIMSDRIGIDSLVWSACGETKILNIKTSVSVRARGNASGLIGVDSLDGKVKQKFGLQWRKCS